jgi:O-antigen/teichoic acid export membrane protein
MLKRLISHYHSRLAHGSFGRNVMVMFIGTALGQFSSFLLSPVLTRLYSPAMFGELGIFTAAITILSVIAALRYEMALPLVSGSAAAANLLAVCGVSLCVTTLISFGLVALLPEDMLGTMTPYRYLLPFGFLCIGAYQVMVYYATQQGTYQAIAQTKIYQGIAGPFTQIVFGFYGIGVWGLIVGFIVGQSTGSTVLFYRLAMRTGELRAVTVKGMKEIAGRFLRFPLLSSWSGLINAAGSNVLLLLIVPLMYSNSIAGFIFLTDRIVGRPLLLVSTSILQVYVGDVSKSRQTDPKAIRRRFLRLTAQQGVIVACWLFLINVSASYLFPIVFGQEWQGAVPYLHVLSITYLPQMVLHPLIHTLQVLERQALSAGWEIGRLASVILVFFYSYVFRLDAWHMLLLYSCCQAAAQLVLYGLMYHSVQSLQKAPSHA